MKYRYDLFLNYFEFEIKNAGHGKIKFEKLDFRLMCLKSLNVISHQQVYKKKIDTRLKLLLFKYLIILQCLVRSGHSIVLCRLWFGVLRCLSSLGSSDSLDGYHREFSKNIRFLRIALRPLSLLFQGFPVDEPERLVILRELTEPIEKISVT